MITIKTKEEIEILKEGGDILAGILDKLCEAVKPGATTADLEDMTRRLMKEAGGRPAQLGFRMPDKRLFPAALCVSINSEIVHAPAMPARTINEGDIVSLDFVMEYPISEKLRAGRIVNKRSGLGGYYTDTAKTVGAGKISEEAKNLIKITEECLYAGIRQIQQGNRLSDIGGAIQKHAEANGYSVVRELVGHGVGYSLHEEPQVANYRASSQDIKDIILKAGMVLAIEPMITIGDWRIKTKEDGFAFATIDDSLSAHFEHSVAVTEYGHEILTKKK
ncbi:type I methionyl aminopeptidase [Candidatus Parcubacteria bacterium]|nr:type I methionyl aminopeptidase [Candidatus Parcubacteria bacterium]